MTDKLLHFGIGFIISAILSLIHPWLGFLAATAAGIAKELHDRTGRGHVEFMDFWWTGFGGVLGALVVTYGL